MKDNALYGAFVAPDQCDRLFALGLTGKVFFFWRVDDFKKDVELVSSFFDKDSYYALGLKMICEATRSRIVPAYTIKDVEVCLPPYLLTRHADGTYEMTLENGWYNGTIKGARLPDIYATMLEALMMGRRVKIPLINSLIEQEQF